MAAATKLSPVAVNAAVVAATGGTRRSARGDSGDDDGGAGRVARGSQLSGGTKRAGTLR